MPNKKIISTASASSTLAGNLDTLFVVPQVAPPPAPEWDIVVPEMPPPEKWKKKAMKEPAKGLGKKNMTPECLAKTPCGYRSHESLSIRTSPTQIQCLGCGGVSFWSAIGDPNGDWSSRLYAPEIITKTADGVVFSPKIPESISIHTVILPETVEMASVFLPEPDPHDDDDLDDDD